ncbi:MFS general substrate transporter [Thozetella sp. PMI_491]|nr:MFS general substrate transporter [Thozetella sp. PMI_491]
MESGLFPPNDPENPQLWPLYKKIYTSLFGATAFSQGIPIFEAEFFPEAAQSKDPKIANNPIQAIVAFSLYIFGIFFAPILTPHMTERLGRRPTYFAGIILNALFVLGTARARTYASIAVCRFFAGFFGGPIAVLVEGTFADLWSALFTSTYYIFIMASQYFGAAAGAIVGGAIVLEKGDWRWTAYIHMMLAAGALVYGAFMPETFPRTIIRRRARKSHVPDHLPEAPTGTKIRTMARLTVTDPIIMLFSEPLVIIISLFLSLNFGVLFTAFVAVPSTLSAGGFDARQIGLAFFGPFGGAALAGFFVLVIDQITARQARAKYHRNMSIEFRMVPPMLGAVLMPGALFWIGWTTRAGSDFPAAVPIAGVGVYVCGSAMTLLGFISYIFDAYPPQATLSALTIMACTRVVSAGWFVLYVPIAVLNIPSQWVFGIWGIIAITFMPIPFVIYKWGESMRKRSSYTLL